MTLERRIESFTYLGEVLRRFGQEENIETSPLVYAAQKASIENPWFTPSLIRLALYNLGESLSFENLTNWLGLYSDRLHSIRPDRIVGIVAAGNIPAVAFHDMLCVLIAGYSMKLKLSSTDQHLLPAMAAELIRFDKSWEDRIAFSKGFLKPFDAVIATGSDNSSRYFDYYFGSYPHIIRKNRTSAALLSGDETLEHLEALASDIMNYFGMGCRNVTFLLVPEGYDFSALKDALSTYHECLDHAKYRNNLDYNRAMFQLNNISFIDAGPILITPSDSLKSRISVLHYYTYSNIEDARALLGSSSERLQCIISGMNCGLDVVLPGMSQKPLPGDYADQIDTMEFLISLNP